MNRFNKILIVCVFGVVGTSGVFWLLNRAPKILADANSARQSAGDSGFSDTVIEDPKRPLPSGAVPGERVIHFSNREDYLRYLKKLSDLGLNPLGTIDSLLSVRISEDVLSQLNPTLYDGQGALFYRIERPLPPSEFDPELLGQLRAFGTTARTIVGDLVEGDGSGVLIAILDSGIQAHPYFDGVGIDSIDLTGVGISGPGSEHGTAIASIVSGSEGIVPSAELLIIRVLDDQGTGTSFDLADGIIRAVDRGAQLINLSLGVYQHTRLLREAVQYAQAQGVLLVAAAGNEGYDRLPYPAAFSQVLAVTAVDGLRRQAVFPNQSEAIDFAAPGVGILAADGVEGAALFSGTSAAAPFVTGTLAALLSADLSPSPQGAVKLVKSYLDDAGAAGTDPVYGDGLLSWDRLRERATTDVSDVALADIYLQPDAQPGTIMPIEVTVQNRGTRLLTTAELKILVGEAVPEVFIIGTLVPGQTTTRKVHIQVPMSQSGETLQIAARVLAEEAGDDVRPENNVKAVFFRAVQ